MTEFNFFSKALLAWYRQYGRHDLPWQLNPTPYVVWVSEIMLQQTQVSTVIQYYQKFINTFSSIKLLSEASEDQVLSLWSGLGYYARARNLHRCAQIICQQYGGDFPTNLEELINLPGIGRSTAGAIASFSMQLRAPILDGNVKRVMTRFYAIEGSPNNSQVVKRLWDLAENHTPHEHYAQYNQAIMDLGATICTRGKPQCQRCPVSSRCQAFATSRVHDFPYPQKTLKSRRQKMLQMLIIKNELGGLLLEKRPSTGIWGGLWSFPECEMDENLHSWCQRQLNAKILSQEKWSSLSHSFTHFDLMIHPVELTISQPNHPIMENSDRIWYKPQEQLPGGISSPVSKLLKKLQVFL